MAAGYPNYQDQISQMFSNGGDTNPMFLQQLFSGGGGGMGGMGFNPWLMGGMGLGSLLGGFMGQQGANGLAGDIKQGMGDITNYANQGLGYLQPFQQAGIGAMGNYSNFLSNYSNPTGMYNNIMSQYKETPAAQFQQSQMMNAANNAAAAGGTLGSPAEQNAVAKYSQGIIDQDQQQYLGNILGIGNQYMQGEGNLMNQGFSAAGQMNQNRLGLGDELAQMYQNLGMANMYGNQSMGAGLGGLFGGLLGGIGAAGGIGNFFSGL